MNKAKQKNGKNQQLISIIFSCRHLLSLIDKFSCRNNVKATKRPLRADGLSLLPSALRPRLVGALVVSLLFSLFLQTSYASNTSAVSLTLTIPSTPLSVNLNPNTDNGFAKSSDERISVSTGANWGYELSVKAKDNNTLKNGANSLSSITTSINEDTFKTGTTHNNKWGFKPSKVNGETNTNFIAGPTSSSSIILERTSEGNNTLGSGSTQYTIAIGAKADNTLATGTYSNNFTFTAVANTVSYSITYNLNEGEWSGKSPQTGSTVDKTIKLDENIPSKDGYEFLGWCTIQPSNNNSTEPTCSGGYIYKAGQDYTLTNGTNIVNLYAVWKNIKPTTLQTFGDYCDEMSEHEEITLKDTRDNTEYTVAKLKDDRCWIEQNMHIINKTIDSTDSDIYEGTFTVPKSDIANFSDTSEQAAYYEGDPKYGALYTWYTAMAGYSVADVLARKGAPNGSICPKGWRLSTMTDYDTLGTLYGDLSKAPFPATFALPGWIVSVDRIYGLYGKEVTAGMWDYDIEPSMTLVGQMVNPGGLEIDNNMFGRLGGSVKCVARKSDELLRVYRITFEPGLDRRNNALDKASFRHFDDFQDGVTLENSIEIDVTTPTLSGYSFKGWCDMRPTQYNVCPGKIINNYDLTEINNYISLYAIWN